MRIRNDFLQVVQVDSPSGVDPEISERGGGGGGGSRILERGAGI